MSERRRISFSQSEGTWSVTGPKRSKPLYQDWETHSPHVLGEGLLKLDEGYLVFLERPMIFPELLRLRRADSPYSDNLLDQREKTFSGGGKHMFPLLGGLGGSSPAPVLRRRRHI